MSHCPPVTHRRLTTPLFPRTTLTGPLAPPFAPSMAGSWGSRSWSLHSTPSLQPPGLRTWAGLRLSPQMTLLWASPESHPRTRADVPWPAVGHTACSSHPGPLAHVLRMLEMRAHWWWPCAASLAIPARAECSFPFHIHHSEFIPNLTRSNIHERMAALCVLRTTGERRTVTHRAHDSVSTVSSWHAHMHVAVRA